MYVQKKLRRKISAAIAAVMILGNSLNAAAAPAQERISSRALAAVETDAYKAELDLEKGSMLLSRNSDKNISWNTADNLSPGATMILGSDGQVREAQMTADGVFDNRAEGGGAAGIRMSGELSGVKSWFMFDSEIVCLGAGIKKTEIGRASCRERV